MKQRAPHDEAPLAPFAREPACPARPKHAESSSPGDSAAGWRDRLRPVRERRPTFSDDTEVVPPSVRGPRSRDAAAVASQVAPVSDQRRSIWEMRSPVADRRHGDQPPKSDRLLRPAAKHPRHALAGRSRRSRSDVAGLAEPGLCRFRQPALTPAGAGCPWPNRRARLRPATGRRGGPACYRSVSAPVNSPRGDGSAGAGTTGAFSSRSYHANFR